MGRVRAIISQSESSKEKWRLPYSAVLWLWRESVEEEVNVREGMLPLPQSPTSSTTEHADDMSVWLEGVGISDIGSDEGEIPSETESMLEG